jgi:MFS superfamily sulfate permease-like transporter
MILHYRQLPELAGLSHEESKGTLKRFYASQPFWRPYNWVPLLPVALFLFIGLSFADYPQPWPGLAIILCILAGLVIHLLIYFRLMRAYLRRYLESDHAKST